MVSPQHRQMMFDAMIDLLPIAFALFDAVGQIIMHHGGLRHILGEVIPSQDMAALDRWELYSADGIRLERGHWPDAQALIDQPVPGECIALLRPAQGEPMLVQFSALPFAALTNQGGGLLFIQSLDHGNGAVHKLHALIAARLGEMTDAADGLGFDVAAVNAVTSAASTPTSPKQLASQAMPTQREADVLKLVAWGYSNKEIARRLGIGVKTVEFHRAQAVRRLHLDGRPAILQYALRNGWLKS